MSDTKINTLGSQSESEKRLTLQQSIKDTFQWFGTHEGFLKDVGNILKNQTLHSSAENPKHMVAISTITKYLSQGGDKNYIQELYDVALIRQKREKLRREMGKPTSSTHNGEVSSTDENIKIKKELQSIMTTLTNIRLNLKGILEDRDQNTGVMLQMFDLIGTTAGFETGADIYQNVFNNQKNRLNKLRSQLINLKQANHLFNDENTLEYQKMIRELQEVEKLNMETVSLLQGVKNSILSLPESTELAWNGTKGIIEGTVNGVKTVLTSALDVSIFLIKLSASGYGIDSQFKYEVHNQAKIIWDYVQQQQLSGLGIQITDILRAEMVKIMNLPSDQQAKAIGNLSGNVIGYIASLQGTVLVSAKVMELGGKVARIQSALEKMNLKGLSQAQRSQKLAILFQQANQGKILTQTLEVFLNGPAEMLIGAHAMKAYLASLEMLKSTKAPHEAYEKLAQSILQKVQDPNVSSLDSHQMTQAGEKSLKKQTQVKTEFHDNVNAHGPLRLEKLRLEDLDHMVDVPRVIDINGEYISIVKASTTADNKKVFTVRYGITNPNVQYPPFEGVSTLVVHDKKIYSMETSSKFHDGKYEKSRQQLLKKISPNGEFSTQNPLSVVEQGKTAKIINGVKKFPDSEIYDIGENAKGYKVLMIKLKNSSGEHVGQFEMNLYPEDGKNVIYIGSMARNDQGGNITKSLEGLMPRLRDILKQFPDKKMPELVYIRAGSDGATGRTIRLPLDKAIDTRVKNPLLKSITLKLLRQIYN